MLDVPKGEGRNRHSVFRVARKMKEKFSDVPKSCNTPEVTGHQ